MKSILSILMALAGCAVAHAQGTFQFSVNLGGANEVPPNTSPATASGTFTLTGNVLDYDFGAIYSATFSPTNATVNGPADVTSTGPVVFDLGAPSFAAPNPPNPGGYAFSGEIKNLTTSQMGDLLAGRWYVNVYTSSGTYPGGEIRGQIVPVAVPEPSESAILGVAGLLACCLHGNRCRRSSDL